MAASVDKSWIITPFMPSLLHIASVNMAVSCCRNFHFRVLENAYKGILYKNLTASTGYSEGNQITLNRAQKIWLSIPEHLRKCVWEAIIGLAASSSGWYFMPVEECNLYVRTEGTIDRITTTQSLLLDKNINIRKRFEIACIYCLEKSIRALWSEMEKSGKIENFDTAEFSMVRFWSNRMRYGSQVPWTQAVLEYIESSQSLPVPVPRFSSFFPLVQPKDRQKCLLYLHGLELDDFRFCLYAMTKEEQEKITKKAPFKILLLHLQWPLQDIFLETAEKICKFIDVETFRKFVDFFFSTLIEGHFKYLELFEAFWHRSPNHLKEIVNECPILRKQID